jgi:hypothetical protein
MGGEVEVVESRRARRRRERGGRGRGPPPGRPWRSRSLAQKIASQPRSRSTCAPATPEGSLKSPSTMRPSIGRPRPLHGALVARDAVLGGDGAPHPGDVPDPRPPDLHEVRCHAVRGVDVVHVDVAGRAVVAAVPYQDGRKIRGEQPVDKRVLAVVGSDDDPVHQAHRQDVVEGLLLRAVPQPEHHAGGQVHELVAHALEQLAEIRVAEEEVRVDVHHDADDTGAAGCERPGGEVGSVARLRQHVLHAAAGLVGYGAAVDHARDGRPRHAAEARQLVDVR